MPSRAMRMPWPAILAVAGVGAAAARVPVHVGQVTVFRNVNVVTMTGDRIVKDRCVVVRGRTIADVVPARTFVVPAGARVIDGAGAYLMPGLADMHVHLTRYTPHSPLNLFLANGVTTVRDLDGTPALLRWRDEVKDGVRPGPTLVCSGWLITDRRDRKTELVRVQRRLGFDCVKPYTCLSPSDLRAVLREARACSMYSVGHVPLRAGLACALESGLDEISHVQELVWQLVRTDGAAGRGDVAGLFDSLFAEYPRQFGSLEGLDSEQTARLIRPRVTEIIRLLRKHRVTVTTTLAADGTIARKCADPEAFLALPTTRYLAQEFVDRLRSGSDDHLVQYRRMPATYRFIGHAVRVMLRELKRSGVDVVLGTDVQPDAVGTVAGFSMHEELQAAVECGFTPYEAIYACTRGASRVVQRMTGRDEFGTVEAGKRADLILLDANPLEDVGRMRHLRGVMAAGRWYAREELDRLAETKSVRAAVVIGESLKQGGIGSAVGTLDSIMASNPVNGCFTSDNQLVALGRSLLDSGMTEEARAILGRSVEYYAASSESWEALADASLRTGDRAGARRLLQTAIALDPGNRSAVRTLRTLEE